VISNQVIEMEKVEWRALDRRVLAVAVEGLANDWAAYIGAVPGRNHSREWRKVAETGTKLPRAVAEVLFPDFKDLRWRD
jgi:hypothetical protein